MTSVNQPNTYIHFLWRDGEKNIVVHQRNLDIRRATQQISPHVCAVRGGTPTMTIHWIFYLFIQLYTQRIYEYSRIQIDFTVCRCHCLAYTHWSFEYGNFVSFALQGNGRNEKKNINVDVVNDPTHWFIVIIIIIVCVTMFVYDDSNVVGKYTYTHNKRK